MDVPAIPRPRHAESDRTDGQIAPDHLRKLYLHLCALCRIELAQLLRIEGIVVLIAIRPEVEAGCDRIAGEHQSLATIRREIDCQERKVKVAIKKSLLQHISAQVLELNIDPDSLPGFLEVRQHGVDRRVTADIDDGQFELLAILVDDAVSV